MSEKLTMMAVHAHPDDEASSTGGVLATYSAQGIRTVVVTCTNGEFGDAPGGIKPGQDGHDDSGMRDWDYKELPDAFCNVPLDTVSGRITQLIEQYRPQVLITYDDKGPYQHPDHVHASRAAQQAFAESGIPAKLYLAATRGSVWKQVFDALREAGEEVPDWEDADPEAARMAAESEARITTTVDIRPVLSRKRDALFAHSSQIQDSFFSKLPESVAEVAFGQETFIRAEDSTGTAVPEDDLFA